MSDERTARCRHCGDEHVCTNAPKSRVAYVWDASGNQQIDQTGCAHANIHREKAKAIGPKMTTKGRDGCLDCGMWLEPYLLENDR